MPNAVLNNLTAPDSYTAGSTLWPLPVCDHVNIDVANNAIYWQIAQTNALTTDRSGSWQQEAYMLPGSRHINRPGIIGIRIRAATPAGGLPAGGLQAQATIEAVW